MAARWWRSDEVRVGFFGSASAAVDLNPFGPAQFVGVTIGQAVAQFGDQFPHRVRPIPPGRVGLLGLKGRMLKGLAPDSSAVPVQFGCDTPNVRRHQPFGVLGIVPGDRRQAVERGRRCD